MNLKAPFPWFGGKARIAPLVWERFGSVRNYVEPFFGSGAMLLARPDWTAGMTETVNDADGMVSNFWRALKADPDAVAEHADWPVNENDLHARHRWLIAKRESLTARLELDPDYFDAKVAGRWVWGLCAWIGHGWCKTLHYKRPHLGNRGHGINRQLPHLGNRGHALRAEFAVLAERFRDVRVCSGDWSRVCGDSVTWLHGVTAVFLDPPYDRERRAELYSIESDVAKAARDWAIANGNNPSLRIAMCGYAGEHEMPGWYEHAWKTKGGYGSQGQGRGRENATRERIWFSPHCLFAKQGELSLEAQD